MGKRRKRPIQLMYQKYGEHSEGVVCAGCCNCLFTKNGGKKIFKCLAYGVTADPSTDWHPSRTACGYFNMPHDEQHKIPLIGLKGIRPQVRREIIIALKRKVTWASYKLKTCSENEKAYFENEKTKSAAKLAELEALENAEHEKHEKENNNGK